MATPGILRPIAAIRSKICAEKSTYLETAYLLLHANCRRLTLKDWTYNVTHHTFIHESIKKFLDGFHTTPTRWHDDLDDRRASHFLSRRERHLQR